MIEIIAGIAMITCIATMVKLVYDFAYDRGNLDGWLRGYNEAYNRYVMSRK